MIQNGKLRTASKYITTLMYSVDIISRIAQLFDVLPAVLLSFVCLSIQSGELVVAVFVVGSMAHCVKASGTLTLVHVAQDKVPEMKAHGVDKANGCIYTCCHSCLLCCSHRLTSQM